MADFTKAFEKTMKHEGGYSNNPTDTGGETYRGISRRYHPLWSGWRSVDILEPKAQICDPKAYIHAVLENEVMEFYAKTFWNPMLLDELPQAIADEMFDTGVNMGIHRAVTFLQRSLNAMNRGGILYRDLVVDGRIGNITLSAVQKIDPEEYRILLVWMNVLQGSHYLEFMTQSPIQESFARGWANRVTLAKG